MNYMQLSLSALIPIAWCGLAQSEIAHHELSFEKLNDAIKIYYIDCGEYPKVIGVLNSEQGCTKWKRRNYKNYSLYDIWENEYQYTYPAVKHVGKVRYELSSYGKDGIEGSKDDIANWLPPEVWQTYYLRNLEQ